MKYRSIYYFLGVILYASFYSQPVTSAPLNWNRWVAFPHQASLTLNNHVTAIDLILPIQYGKNSLWYGGIQTQSLYVDFGSLVSIGTGYRSIVVAPWMVGLSTYVDVGKLPPLWAGYYGKLSPGIEVRSPLWGITLNAYIPITVSTSGHENKRLPKPTYYKGHNEFETRYMEPYYWGVDGKLSRLFFSRLNTSLGAYYILQDKENNVWGGNVGVEYALNARFKVGFKHSFDFFHRHYTTLSLQIDGGNQVSYSHSLHRLLWHPVDRYVVPLSLNKDHAIQENIYFLRSKSMINGETLSPTEATFENPSPVFLDIEKIYAGKKPSTISSLYISNGIHEGSPIPFDIGEVTLHHPWRIIGRGPRFEKVELSGMQPVLRGVVELGRTQNTMANKSELKDFVLQPLRLDKPSRYRMIENTGHGRREYVTAGIIANEVENIIMQNVQVMGAPDQKNALQYSTGIEIAKGNHFLLDQIGIDHAKLGLSLANSSDIRIRNMNMGQQGRIMVGIWGKQAKDVQVQSSNIEALEYTVDIQDKSSFEINSTHQRLHSGKQARTVSTQGFPHSLTKEARENITPIHVQDSRLAVQGNNEKDSKLTISAPPGAKSINMVWIEKGKEGDKKEKGKVDTSFILSNTEITYNIKGENCKPGYATIGREVSSVSFVDNIIRVNAPSSSSQFARAPAASGRDQTLIFKGNKIETRFTYVRPVSHQGKRKVRMPNNNRVVSRPSSKASPVTPKSSSPHLPAKMPKSPGLPPYAIINNLFHKLPEGKRNQLILDIKLAWNTQMQVIEASNLTASQKMQLKAVLFKKRGKSIISAQKQIPLLQSLSREELDRELVDMMCGPASLGAKEEFLKRLKLNVLDESNYFQIAQEKEAIFKEGEIVSPTLDVQDAWLSALTKSLKRYEFSSEDMQDSAIRDRINGVLLQSEQLTEEDKKALKQVMQLLSIQYPQAFPAVGGLRKEMVPFAAAFDSPVVKEAAPSSDFLTVPQSAQVEKPKPKTTAPLKGLNINAANIKPSNEHMLDTKEEKTNRKGNSTIQNTSPRVRRPAQIIKPTEVVSQRKPNIPHSPSEESEASSGKDKVNAFHKLTKLNTNPIGEGYWGNYHKNGDTLNNLYLVPEAPATSYKAGKGGAMFPAPHERLSRYMPKHQKDTSVTPLTSSRPMNRPPYPVSPEEELRSRAPTRAQLAYDVQAVMNDIGVVTQNPIQNKGKGRFPIKINNAYPARAPLHNASESKELPGTVPASLQATSFRQRNPRISEMPATTIPIEQLRKSYPNRLSQDRRLYKEKVRKGQQTRLPGPRPLEHSAPSTKKEAFSHPLPKQFDADTLLKMEKELFMSTEPRSQI